jgi:Zn-dependent peptidase ImmA (M78 family)/DNA-binding XRE family transcriptional regulator
VSFNSDMLKLARDARELTQADLAKIADVTQALVSKIENGLVTQPSDEVVEKLARAVNRPISFFYQQERIVGFPHFHYRKRTKLGARALAKIAAIINIRRQHIVKLLRSYENPPEKPIPQFELDVLCRFNTNHLDGISFRSEGLPPLFFMNRDVPGERFRFSLAHELGHIILHGVPSDDEKMEEEAHRFAAAFLMPAAEIRPYLTTPKLSAFARVKAFWKVSIKALIKRAHDLKLITDNQYRWLNVQYSKSFRAGEPNSIPLESPSRLRVMVEYHLTNLGYNLTELARLLSVHVEDLERAYAPHPGLRLVVSK